MVVLDGPADPVWMQSVATEVNVSATAFLHRIDDSWGLRWFTPTVEVDLCGHATLASAHHLMIDHGITDPVVTFETRSGRLLATRLDAGWVELDLPADPPAELPAPDGLLAALRLDTEQVVDRRPRAVRPARRGARRRHRAGARSGLRRPPDAAGSGGVGHGGG